MAFTLEQLRQKHPHAKPQKVFTAQDLKERHAFNAGSKPPEEIDTNLGTGFQPSFESLEEDSVVTDLSKAIGNVPKSGMMLAKDVWTAISNPIDTAKAVKTLVEGASANVAQNALENTDWGQSIIEKMNQSRIERGLPELDRDENGKLLIPDTEASAVADQVGEYYRDRYGSWKNFRESLVEDPVGVLGDVSTVVTGSGAIIKGTGTVSRSSRVAQLGQSIQKAGDALEPTTAISRGVSELGRRTAQTLPGRMIGEAAPTAGRFAEGEVVKALDLTQGDVARISQKTGNDVTEFISRNNLLRETPEEIAMALDSFQTNQYRTVRSEVAKVTDIYNASDVPRVQQALSTVQQTVNDIPGLEETAAEVNRLIQQDTYSLNDIQRVKEILDANTNIFTRSGEARGVATAQGLANVRSELRRFIEDEVNRVTNGQTNINRLNNDVSTSRELADAIELRETRDLTRNYNPLTSTLLGGATFAGTGDIFAAIGVGVTAKLLQTPSFRLALARSLKATPVQDLKRWSNEVSTGNLSPQTRQSLARIVREAKNNAQFIESGSQAVTETTQSTEQAEQQ